MPPRSRSSGTVAVTPSGLVGSLAVLVAVAVCIRLGFWQLDRRAQRAELNARLESRISQPVVELDSPVADTTGLTYRRVRVQGTYDHERSIVLPGRSLRGAPGVHVLTPMRLDGAGAVLVNRGWLPAADAATVDLEAVARPVTATSVGLALPFPGGAGRGVVEPVATDSFRRVWYAVDSGVLRDQFPYALLPVEVRLLPEAGDSAMYPVRLAAPSLDAGPHLGYAIQWFSFAVIAVIGWIALARKGRHT